MHVVVDIETIPDQRPGAIDEIAKKIQAPASMKKVETISDWNNGVGKYKGEKEKAINEAWLKTSFDGAAGQIACIGFQVVGSDHINCIHGCEKDMLVNFWRKVSGGYNSNTAPFFIAHNAKFDLPFLYHRSVINKVEVPLRFNPHGKNGQDHFCTMESWAGFNKTISLDRLSSALGIKGKQGMSGADVWPEFQKGNIQKIAEYCKDDVRITGEIYQRMTFGG